MKRVSYKITAMLSAMISAVAVIGIVWTIYYQAPIVELIPKWPVSGIDVSSHNGYVDYEAIKGDSVEFVIMKATEGATFKDTSFVDNYRRARLSGLKVGAYHFFRFETNGEMQAINFLNSVRGRKLDLPLIIDVEEWGNPHERPTGEIQSRLLEMASYIEEEGYPVMFYTNLDGYRRFMSRSFDQYPLWICSFNDPPLENQANNFVLWQFSHRGLISGVKGRVDRNVFVGEREEFNRWLRSIEFQAQY